MAVLQRNDTGQQVTLTSRALVGRERACAITISHPRVSREHAVVFWTGTLWRIRDLGSRNGTFVNGRRLGGGEEVALGPGAVLLFGDTSVQWCLIDDGPPIAMAIALGGGADQHAQGGVLALPHPEDPQVSIFRDGPGGWVIEREDGISPVQDGAVVRLGARSWRLSLPAGTDGTMEPEQFLRLGIGLGLRFAVSQDEEYVEVVVVHGAGRQQRLEPRSYHYALLTLARARLKDSGAPELERGWIYADDLAKMLAVDRRTLNVHLHRARQQLGELGLDSGGFLIERRPGTGQIRIGVGDLTVSRLEP